MFVVVVCQDKEFLAACRAVGPAALQFRAVGPVHLPTTMYRDAKAVIVQPGLEARYPLVGVFVQRKKENGEQVEIWNLQKKALDEYKRRIGPGSPGDLWARGIKAKLLINVGGGSWSFNGKVIGDKNTTGNEVFLESEEMQKEMEKLLTEREKAAPKKKEGENK